MKYPRRKIINHTPPGWVPAGEPFFLTLNGSPRGENQFAKGDPGRLLLESAKFNHDRAHWFCRILMIMPDHLHMVISLPPQNRLDSVLASWKRYLSRNYTFRWQRDFFDHRLRNRESLDQKMHYIRMNPVRKGLVETPSDWPWQWEP